MSDDDQDDLSFSDKIPCKWFGDPTTYRMFKERTLDWCEVTSIKKASRALAIRGRIQPSEALEILMTLPRNELATDKGVAMIFDALDEIMEKEKPAVAYQAYIELFNHKRDSKTPIGKWLTTYEKQIRKYQSALQAVDEDKWKNIRDVFDLIRMANMSDTERRLLMSRLPEMDEDTFTVKTVKRTMMSLLVKEDAVQDKPSKDQDVVKDRKNVFWVQGDDRSWHEAAFDKSVQCFFVRNGGRSKVRKPNGDVMIVNSRARRPHNNQGNGSGPSNDKPECLGCGSQEHRLLKCPVTSEKQKTILWEKFKKEREARDKSTYLVDTDEDIESSSDEDCLMVDVVTNDCKDQKAIEFSNAEPAEVIQAEGPRTCHASNWTAEEKKEVSELSVEKTMDGKHTSDPPDEVFAATVEGQDDVTVVENKETGAVWEHPSISNENVESFLMEGKGFAKMTEKSMQLGSLRFTLQSAETKRDGKCRNLKGVVIDNQIKIQGNQTGRDELLQCLRLYVNDCQEVNIVDTDKSYPGDIVLDTACASPMGSWGKIETYIQHAKAMGCGETRTEESNIRFKFAGGNRECAEDAVILPWNIGGCKGTLKVNRLKCIPKSVGGKDSRTTPILIGPDQLEQLKIEINFGTQTLSSTTLGVKDIPLRRSAAGHFVVNFLAPDFKQKSEILAVEEDDDDMMFRCPPAPMHPSLESDESEAEQPGIEEQVEQIQQDANQDEHQADAEQMVEAERKEEVPKQKRVRNRAEWDWSEFVGSPEMKEKLMRPDGLKHVHVVFGHDKNAVMNILKLTKVPRELIRLAEEEFNNCELCKKFAPKPRHSKAGGRVTKVFNEMIYSDVSDLIFNDPEGEEVRIKLLHILEDMTAYSFAQVIETKEKEATLKVLIEYEQHVGSSPQILRADEGTEFDNELWNFYLSRRGINPEPAPVDTPQANRVERHHTTVKLIFKKLYHDVFLEMKEKNLGKPDSRDVMKWACIAKNDRPKTSTGKSPHQEAFGRNNIWGLYDLSADDFNSLEDPASHSLYILKQELLSNLARVAAAEVHASTQLRRALAAQKVKTDYTINVGDEVEFYIEHKKGSKRGWLGRGTIEACKGTKVCIVKQTNGFSKTVPRNRIRLRGDVSWMNEEKRDNDGIEDIVDNMKNRKLLGQRVKRGGEPVSWIARGNTKGSYWLKDNEGKNLRQVSHQQLIRNYVFVDDVADDLAGESEDAMESPKRRGRPRQIMAAERDGEVRENKKKKKKKKVLVYTLGSEDGENSEQQQPLLTASPVAETATAAEQFEIFEDDDVPTTHFHNLTDEEDLAEGATAVACIPDDSDDDLQEPPTGYPETTPMQDTSSESEYEDVDEVFYVQVNKEAKEILLTKKQKRPKDLTKKEVQENEVDPGFAKADAKELESWIKAGCFKVVHRSQVKENANIIPSKWVRQWRYTPEGAISKSKSRICARGDCDKRIYEGLRTDSPTANPTSVNLLLQWAVDNGYRIEGRDVSTAFLLGRKFSEDAEPIYMEPPEGTAHPDILWQLTTAVYGLNDAPRGYYEEFKTEVMKHMYQSRADPCLFIYAPDMTKKSQETIDEKVRRLREGDGGIGIQDILNDVPTIGCKVEGVMTAHVDDCMLAGSQKFLSVINSIEERFPFGTKTDAVEGMMYTGCWYKQKEDLSEVLKSMKPYIESNLEMPDIETTGKEDAQELSQKEHTEFRAGVGGCIWIQYQGDPTRSCEVAKLTQALATPTMSDAKELKSVVARLKKEPIELRFRRLESKKRRLLAYGDCSFATGKNGSSQSGKIFCLCEEKKEGVPDTKGSIVGWSSKKLKRVARSTIAGEGLTLLEVVDEGDVYSYIASEMYGERVELDVRTDHMGLVESILSMTQTKEKGLSLALHAIRQRKHGDMLRLRHVRTEYMLADPLTKKMIPWFLWYVIHSGTIVGADEEDTLRKSFNKISPKDLMLKYSAGEKKSSSMAVDKECNMVAAKKTVCKTVDNPGLIEVDYYEKTYAVNDYPYYAEERVNNDGTVDMLPTNPPMILPSDPDWTPGAMLLYQVEHIQYTMGKPPYGGCDDVLPQWIHDWDENTMEDEYTYGRHYSLSLKKKK